MSQEERSLVPYTNSSVVDYADDVEMNLVQMDNHVDVGRSGALLETDNTHNPPPTYGPEIDDLEPAHRRGINHKPYDDRGIDDGLLTPRPMSPRTSDGYLPITPFDVNVYQQKKTLAQGMMDLALISANANQLRYVLESKNHPFYYASLTMICLSLSLQIAVGIGLIWNSRYDVKEDTQVPHANRANNWTVIGVFLVTILNVFISSFGVIDSSDVVTSPLKDGLETDDGIESLRSTDFNGTTFNSTILT
uniref:Ninjurin-1 n=1 Tax=Bracon brevicornis TaxID=1563983 RepID=A0A6V7IVU7_9HYME